MVYPKGNVVATKLFHSQKKLKYISLAAALVVIVIISVVLILVLRPKSQTNRAAIVSNGPGCSDIGINIIAKGGTVADAAIAALFCEGVNMPQSMGLGGGFLMTLYKRDTGEVISLNSREIAPSGATEDMFRGNATLASQGGLSVAVPGELKGYWELYKRYGGGVAWKDLVQPSIDLCYNGIKITPYVHNALRLYSDIILRDPLLTEIFTNPETNDMYAEGEIYKRPKLAKTLEVIAEEGGDTLNNGSLTKSFVRDIQNQGGIITIEDMNNFMPRWQIPINTTLGGNRTLYTQPLPSSGAVVALTLNILDDYLDLEDTESLDNYQKIVESFKFSYAQRTQLGDDKFVDVEELLKNITSKSYAESIRNLINTTSTSSDASFYGANVTITVPDDHGTANLCILAPNGDAIVVTSTINNPYGAGFVSESTGIILNDEMDDFSSKNMSNLYGLEPSPANYIAPGKNPLSSMSPTIILDKNGDVEMAIGGAGGSKIITIITQVIIRHLWYNKDLLAASNFRRLHHQLLPMRIDFEPEFQTEDPETVEGLRKIGHQIGYTDGRGFTAVTSISTKNGRPVGSWDNRRSGSVTYL